MKFEKITDAKIKIILSIKDVKLHNISAENFSYNSSDCQKLLEKMLNTAEKEIGFITGDSQLLVEAISQPNGECVFTITKLLDDNPCCKKIKNCFIYKFNNFDNFLNLCTFLNNFSYIDLKGFSKIFSLFLYNGAYYLIASNIQNYAFMFNILEAFFSEFGNDVSGVVGMEGLLNEYGKVIFEKNAIQKGYCSFSKNST